MGFPALFEKKKKTIGSIHFIPGIYPYGMSLFTPIHFRVPSLIFLKNSHLCSIRLQNRSLYWIFLDEVGSDQSGGILSPFMGTACYICLSVWYNFWTTMQLTGQILLWQLNSFVFSNSQTRTRKSIEMGRNSIGNTREFIDFYMYELRHPWAYCWRIKISLQPPLDMQCTLRQIPGVLCPRKGPGAL